MATGDPQDPGFAGAETGTPPLLSPGPQVTKDDSGEPGLVEENPPSPSASSTSLAPRVVIDPLPYHQALREYLQAEEPDVWQWYTSHKNRDEQAEAVRFELLKSTYRLDPDLQPAIYETAQEVARALGLDIPLTIYQAQNPQGLNASLAFVPGEAHIILHGPVSSKLTADEFRALLAHELSHFLLWQSWNGEYLVTEQILAAMTHDRAADTPHFASARLFALYSELFCDRAALLVTGDPLVVISMLLKVETQLDEVSPESYLRQADEVFGRGPATTEGLSHPEAFIRARSLKLWSDNDPQCHASIQEMLEGRPALNNLDLLAQRRVAELTRRLINGLLSHRWMQSAPVLAHARLFFEDYAPPADRRDDAVLAEDLRTDDVPLQDYYSYVLLDFVTADRDLEELPLAAALLLAENVGLKERFFEIAKRELRLRKRQLESIDQDKEKLLAQAHSSHPREAGEMISETSHVHIDRCATVMHRRNRRPFAWSYHGGKPS